MLQNEILSLYYQYDFVVIPDFRSEFNPLLQHQQKPCPIRNLLQNRVSRPNCPYKVHYKSGRDVAGAVRNLQRLNGVFFARVAVPKELRGVVGKSELRANLGKDRKAAQHRLHVEVAKFLDILADARRRVNRDARTPKRVLTAVELAHLH